MRDVISWGDYFMGLAHEATKRSKDPNTNVGAVLVDENRSIIETGYNGFPPLVKDTDKRWQRPTKYDFVVHAEANAIARAAKAGKKTDGSTIYITHYPCKDCAKLIIAAGVKNVIVDGAGTTLMNDDAQKAFTSALFIESGVQVFVTL
jgi:dCMP deaminase